MVVKPVTKTWQEFAQRRSKNAQVRKPLVWLNLSSQVYWVLIPTMGWNAESLAYNFMLIFWNVTVIKSMLKKKVTSKAG